VIEDGEIAIAATELCNAAIYTDDRRALRGCRNRQREEIAQDLDLLPWFGEGLRGNAADARWEDHHH
jgi:hypothetical protein